MRPFVIQAKAILGLNLRRNAPCLSSTVSRFLNSPWFVQDPHEKYEGPTNQRRQFASMYTNGQKHELNEKQGESRVIDLRSDTVTKPTKEMRAAIAAAEVGDDVYGDDPTVNAIQTKAAELTEKEAALFVTSGTMGNLAAVMAHCTGHD